MIVFLDLAFHFIHIFLIITNTWAFYLIGGCAIVKMVLIRYNLATACVVKLVDAMDSKSIDSDIVPVRVRPQAPVQDEVVSKSWRVGIITYT